MSSLLSPIWWRIKFILFEMWGKAPHIILYSLFPWVRHKKNIRERFLEERGYIRWDRQGKTISAAGLTFGYPNRVPTGNIVSIVLGNEPYVRDNFVDNSALRQEGPYERYGVVLDEDDVVIDAGANIGIFSVVAGRKVGPDGIVFAFEPIAAAREVLEQNAARNGLKNIETVPMALGESKEALLFHVDEKALGSSSAVLNEDAPTIDVTQTTLDTFVDEHGLDRVDFIKADIEGMERHMLKGAEQTIKRFKPKLAICTYHLPDDPAVLREMVQSFVPEYTVRMSRTKLYAWIEKN